MSQTADRQATQLNADVALRVVVQSAQLPWLDAPTPLIKHKVLMQGDGENAKASAVIKLLPGANVADLPHQLGEEIFVLEGSLSDAKGDHPAGSYIKNPAGSNYSPYSKQGCTLFVRRRQMDAGDEQKLVINTHSAQWFEGMVKGLTVLPLTEFGSQHTAMVRWAPQTFFNPHRHFGGEEIFVVEGVFSDEHGDFPAGSWMRSPHLSQHQPFSREGCLILVKTGHLI
jgi:anti-sigma factor ChrR (cupin superfamily)